MKKFISVVPIRKGSKGLKNKNLLEIKNKPLYKYAIIQGLNTADKCYVTTDIESVLNLKSNHSLRIIKRPKELAQDNTSMRDVLINLISTENLEKYNIILLQATSPLRTEFDINKSKEIFLHGNFSMVMSVTNKSSNIFKYGQIEGANFKPHFNRLLFENRQSLPNVFGPNGAVYIFDAQKFLDNGNFPSSNIGAYLMPEERSIDIDSIKDFKAIKKIFEK